jgi:hypothetical protein
LSWLRKIGEKSRFITSQWQAWWKATQIVDSSTDHVHGNSTAHSQCWNQARCRAKNSISKSIFPLGLSLICSSASVFHTSRAVAAVNDTDNFATHGLSGNHGRRFQFSVNRTSAGGSPRSSL